MKNLRKLSPAAQASVPGRLWPWFCALLACLLSVPALADSPALVVDGRAPHYAVAPHTDFLKDDSGTLDFDQILTRSDQFRPSSASGEDEINFGYSGSSYWLRFTVDMTQAATDGLLLEVGFPSLDQVEMYAQSGGTWTKRVAGDLQPFSVRPFTHRNFVFPLPRESGAHTFYLRVHSAGTVTIPLQLWQTDAFARHEQKSYAALALYFGMLLALMLYNLLLYFSLRDRSYLAYVFFVASMAIGQASLTGMGNQFVWPDWPAWGNAALPCGFAATTFFAGIFTRRFLDTARMAPRHDLVLRLFIWLAAFIVLSPLFLPYAFAAVSTSLLGIVFPAVAASTGFVCLRRGQPGARYFLLAWALLLCGTALLALRNMGIVPTNFLTLYAMLIGSSLEVLLLSFALADRIHVLRREKELAQSEALAASQRAEQELESRVDERTSELSETNARLLASEEYERNRNKVLEILAKGAPITEILTTMAQAVEQAAPGKLCSILLADEAGKRLMVGAAPSLMEFYSHVAQGIEIGEGQGSCGTAAARGERVIVEDIQTDPLWSSIRNLAARTGLAACWSEPILSGQSEVLGTFAIYQRHPGGPSPDDLEMIRQHRHLASIAIERKRLDERMWMHANYDQLTKLPNRRLFRDRLQQSMKKTRRAGLPLALMFIDLDLFKEVNDTLGHDMGDLLLVDVARRISSCVRSSDTVARISGDEFTVILSELAETNCTEKVARNIIRSLTQPFHIGGETIYISASIGITFYPNDTAELEGLLKNADQAMYAAKSQGRNGHSYFTNRMQEEAQNRMHLIRDLREALNAGQFKLYFQPIVDMKDGRIVKAEALLRWAHPERGLVGPAQFISIAEETGMIQDISDWVFREAAGWMKRWHDQGRSCMQVSVNRSASQFSSSRDPQYWFDMLHEIGLPSACIAVEITEGSLLDERRDVASSLLQFRDAGIQVAIDDFGTGYSALSYLKKFDIDYLKIDQSFVRDLATDPSDLALSEAIIVMAHKLGLKVVAEGVETIEQHDMLCSAGCDYAQGYLYAKPMSAEEFDALLARPAGNGPGLYGTA